MDPTLSTTYVTLTNVQYMKNTAALWAGDGTFEKLI